jgi:glutamate 5-kinase
MTKGLPEDKSTSEAHRLGADRERALTDQPTPTPPSSEASPSSGNSDRGSDDERRERAALAGAKRVVVKIGSKLLAEAPTRRPAAIADQVAALRRLGIEIVLVSSGAIALGIERLKLASRPTELPILQAAAAVGQSTLMQHWDRGFSVHSIAIGQVLVTHDDMGDRQRFLSARMTLRALLDHHVVPIINENDTVASDEIKFGDNDQLAALVCNLVSADALVMLTDVEGVRDATGVRIPIVRDVEREAVAVAGKSTSGVGSGGMASKVGSARIATRTGIPAVVAPGREPDVLPRVLRGDDVGTLFIPMKRELTARRHWIAYGAKPAGTLVVDEGAAAAVSRHHKSLLPAGILSVDGEFQVGDTVAVATRDGNEIARGLVAYAAEDLRRLCGAKSSAIDRILGWRGADEAIHRDDLVVV